MQTLRDFMPGQKQLSASQLNELVQHVRALVGMQVSDGLQVSREGGVFNLTTDRKEPGFWAKITGEGTSTLAGKYAWTEQTDVTGSFADLTGGRSGTVNGVSGATTTVEPLREANGATGIATNTYVWVIEGNPTVDTGTTGNPIDSHYRFVMPPSGGGGYPSLEYINCYIPYTGGSIFDVPLDSSYYKVNTWDGTSTGAIEFPSTGYWKVSASIIGSVEYYTSPATGAYQYLTVVFSWGGGGASEIIAPIESTTVPSLFYPGWYAASSGALNQFSPILTQTRDFIVKVNTANVEAFTVYGFGVTAVGWEGKIHQGSTVIGHKIAEL